MTWFWFYLKFEGGFVSSVKYFTKTIRLNQRFMLNFHFRHRQKVMILICHINGNFNWRFFCQISEKIFRDQPQKISREARSWLVAQYFIKLGTWLHLNLESAEANYVISIVFSRVTKSHVRKLESLCSAKFARPKYTDRLAFSILILKLIILTRKDFPIFWQVI